jgi:hypothetical protein
MHDRDLEPSRNPAPFKSVVKLWEARKFGMGFRITARTITSWGSLSKFTAIQNTLTSLNITSIRERNPLNNRLAIKLSIQCRPPQ